MTPRHDPRRAAPPVWPAVALAAATVTATVTAGGVRRLDAAEAAPPAAEIRIRDVGDIASRRPESPGHVTIRGSLLLTPWPGGSPSTAWVGAPLHILGDPSYGEPTISFSDEEEGGEGRWLVLFIAECVADAGLGPLLVDGLDPDIAVRRGRLFLRASPEVHDFVDGLLRPLQRREDERILVEALFAPTAALDRAAPTWRQEGPRLAGEVFDRVLLSPGSRLVAAAPAAGEWVTASSGDEESIVADFEINQTGVIPVTNPVIRTAVTGEWLDVRACPLPDRRSVLVDLALASYRTDPKQRRVGAEWSDLDLDVRGEEIVSVSIAASPGETLLAGRLGERVVLLRVRRQAAPGEAVGEAPPAGSPDLTAHDVSLLERGEHGRTWWGTDGPSGYGKHDGGFDIDLAGPDAAERHALNELAARLWGSPEEESRAERERSPWLRYDSRSHMAFLRAPAEERARFERALGEEAARRLVAATVELELLELDRERFVRLRSLAPDGLRLEDGWREKVATGSKLASREFAVTGVAGETHAVRVADIHPLIVDVENISGGTGFAISEAVDPMVRTCGEGTQLLVRVDLPDAGATARLRVNGVDTKIREIREVELIQPVPADPSGGSTTERRSSKGSTTSGSAGGTPEFRTRELQLHLPKQAVRVVDFCRRVPVGRDIILHSDTSRGDTATVLVGRVRRTR